MLEAAAAVLPITRRRGRCHSNFYPGGSQDLLFGRLPAGLSHQSQARNEDAVCDSLGVMAKHCTEMVRI